MSFRLKPGAGRGRTLAAVAVSVAAGLGASAAWADPCKAIPDRGPMPPELAPGRRFAGPVVYVGDGDSLCVALGAGDEDETAVDHGQRLGSAAQAQAQVEEIGQGVVQKAAPEARQTGAGQGPACKP
jgi:hypothetical protein